MKNASFSSKVFCPTFLQKSWWGAERPVDVRPAPTGAKRRLGETHKKDFIDRLKPLAMIQGVYYVIEFYIYSFPFQQ